MYESSGPTLLDTQLLPRDPERLTGNRKEPHSTFRDQAEPIISAAEKCAALVTNFTVELMSWDFAGFWYSCMSYPPEFCYFPEPY